MIKTVQDHSKVAVKSAKEVKSKLVSGDLDVDEYSKQYSKAR